MRVLLPCFHELKGWSAQNDAACACKCYAVATTRCTHIVLSVCEYMLGYLGTAGRSGAVGVGVSRLHQAFFVWICETHHQPDLWVWDVGAAPRWQFSTNFYVRCWVQRLGQWLGGEISRFSRQISNLWDFKHGRYSRFATNIFIEFMIKVHARQT